MKNVITVDSPKSEDTPKYRCVSCDYTTDKEIEHIRCPKCDYKGMTPEHPQDILSNENLYSTTDQLSNDYTVHPQDNKKPIEESKMGAADVL